MSSKIALVAGGARGIGRAISLALAQSGWDVAFCYRTNKHAAESTLQKITETGQRCISLCCDVSDHEAASVLIKTVEKKWNRIDALINCVGPYHRIPLLDESTAGWHEMFDHNLHPTFYLCRAVADGMKKCGWGRIINFGLVNAEQMTGQTNITAYYIAKSGVIILSRALARLLAANGITVNTISPGYIDSGGIPAEELIKIERKIPAGRTGTTDEVVAVVQFLLSDDAGYVNGANIQVSGGWGI